MPEAPEDPRTGTALGGYRVGERIGRGGMGVVYRAEHVRLSRPVALKIVAPELADDADFATRFAREAQMAATLDHPHVVTVYDAGEADGALFLAMQLVEGGDLAQELAVEGALEPERAATIGLQLARALDAAHALGLVHRDVKPANVLLARGEAGSRAAPHAYLTDFGLARTALRGRATRAGELVGTIDYVSPEQIEGDRLDGRADQYALAGLLHHLLCGRPPFQRESDVATMYAHLRDVPPAPSTVRAGLPVALDAVLARGLDKVASRRFGNCLELAEAVRDALAELPQDAARLARVVPPEGDPPSAVTETDLPRVEVTMDRRPRVLLADVDAQVRALVHVALAGRCEIQETDERTPTLDAARAFRPDLVLLDAGATDPDAAEVLRSLRQDPVTRDARVMLAVDWRSAIRLDLRELGADDVVETPFSPLQLQVKLRRLLGAEAIVG